MGLAAVLALVAAILINPLLFARTGGWPTLPRILVRFLVNAVLVWIALGRMLG
jgi:hypothetical protein